VWGSEFPSKDAALQGGLDDNSARLNVKLCDLPAWLVASYPFFRPILLYTEI